MPEDRPLEGSPYRPVRRFGGVRQLLVEIAPVGKSGQRIVQGVVLDAGLRRFELRVLELGDESRALQIFGHAGSVA